MKLRRFQSAAIVFLTTLVAWGNPSYGDAPPDWVTDFRAAMGKVKNTPDDASTESCLYQAAAWIDISAAMRKLNNLMARYREGANYSLSLEDRLGGGDNWFLWAADFFTPFGLSVAAGNVAGNVINDAARTTEVFYKNKKGETVKTSLVDASSKLNMLGGAFHKSFCCTCVDALKDTTIHDMHCRNSKEGAWKAPNGEYWKKYCERKDALSTPIVTGGE